MKAKPITGYMIKTHRNVLIANSFQLREKVCVDNYAYPGMWAGYVQKGYRCVPVIIEERDSE